MKVEIKERQLPNGNRSLYLEYYEPGFRKRESLGLFLVPEESKEARRANKATYRKALEIKSQRVLNPKDFSQEKKGRESTELTWIEWAERYYQWSVECGNCRKMVDHKRIVNARIKEYLTATKSLSIKLNKVTARHINGLYDYMRNTYRNHRQASQNGGRLADFTLLLFGETVNAMFNKAVRDGLIGTNPVQGLSQLEKFHAPDKHREFLTAEEFLAFIQVEPRTDQEWQVQHAFGFSCMTGLRLSDIRQLRWNHITTIGDTPAVSLVQQKTRTPVTIPLNDMALSLLPERPANGSDTPIFHLSRGHGAMGMYVRRLKERAGIAKDLTYHCSRHTSATLAITAGASLPAVSKILGHKSLAATAIYATVDLSTRAAAVNRLSEAFN